MARVSLSFSQPRHGWLPTTLSVDDVREEFHASNVGLDPVVELRSAVLAVFSGREARVLWYLEPAGFLLTLSPKADEVSVRIQYSDDVDLEQRELSEVVATSGSRKEVLAPLIEALRGFERLNAGNEHWAAVSMEALEPIEASFRD
jgi:hypothetical protein